MNVVIKRALDMTGTAILLAALAFVLPDTPAPAAPTHVFVLAQGSDSNPCTFALPCRK
jgi:hypothetical protein